jgi:predicted dehydrogenase
MLNRVGEGRVALLASDHAWLWDRGYEGGGPQLEMLRRLAHWMMGEPDLEEEALVASAEGQTLNVTRRTLADEAGDVTVTYPDGTEGVLTLSESAPGALHRRDRRRRTGALSPDGRHAGNGHRAGPRRTARIRGNHRKRRRVCCRVTEPLSGAVMRLEDGMPDIRRVAEGRNASGRGWIGVTTREAYLTTDVTITPLVSAWLFLLIAAGLMLGAWLREGRN